MRKSREGGPGRFIAALLVFAWSCVSATAAFAAEESVIVKYAQEAGDGVFTASFTIDGRPEARVIRLKNPDRIAIDFPETLPATDIAALDGDNSLVGDLRHGLVAADRYRVIYSLEREAHAELKRRETANGEVLSLVITAGKAPERPVSAVTVSGTPDTVATQAPGAPRDARSRTTRPLTIVLDPGHGGIDEGAVSDDGTKEKAINLAMGLALRDALSKTEGIEVVMTRDDDTFIPLAERSAIGRRERADLFISIHADSIRYDELRGATVYTLSENASDALSRQIAASENAADRFAGEEWQGDKPDVFDILVELTRRETVGFSEHFAGSLVDDLADSGIRLINRPKRSAGFKVLKAPDVPSVLVEMGFLSNDADEKLLKDDAWRHKVSDAIAASIVKFFRGAAGEAATAERQGE